MKQPLSFVSRAEPDEVELGRPFHYVIEVRHGAEQRYELPPLEGAMGTLALRGVSAEQQVEEGGSHVSTFRVELAVYDSLGEVQLPEIELVVREGEEQGTLAIPGASVKIRQTSEGTELVGMRPPEELLVPAWGWAWGLGALLLAVLAVVLWKRRRPAAPPEVVAPVDPRTPEERALERLDELEAQSLWADGKGREHYFALSEVLRAFLHEIDALPAQEMTTGELLASLEETPLPGLSFVWATRWFTRGDFIRYAGQPVDPAAARSDLEEARAAIRAVAGSLRQREAPAAEALP